MGGEVGVGRGGQIWVDVPLRVFGSTAALGVFDFSAKWNADLTEDLTGSEM